MRLAGPSLHVSGKKSAGEVAVAEWVGLQIVKWLAFVGAVPSCWSPLTPAGHSVNPLPQLLQNFAP